MTLNGRLIDIASIKQAEVMVKAHEAIQGQEPGRLNIREKGDVDRAAPRRPSVAMVEIDTRVRAARESPGKPISIKNLFSHWKFFNTGALDEFGRPASFPMTRFPNITR